MQLLSVKFEKTQKTVKRSVKWHDEGINMTAEERKRHPVNAEKKERRKPTRPTNTDKEARRKPTCPTNTDKGERRKSTRPTNADKGERRKPTRPMNTDKNGAGKKRATTHTSLADGYGKEPMRQTRRQKKKKKKNLVSNLILVVAIVVFLVSGFQLVRMLVPYFTGGAEYNEVKKMAEWSNDSDKAKQKAAKFQVDFDKLKEINPDTVAWIRFDEPAVISYPVVQTDDNDTYLKKTFQANDNKLGAIFMDYQNASDFSDRNTMIYGHNLKVGGEMFSQLKDYSEESFYKDHPYFYIYTPDGKTKTYQIFAAGVVKDTADNFRLSYTSDEDYESYLQLAKSISSYDTGVEVNKDSKIVTLSTCTNVKEDERFLVYGVLTKEETADGDSEDASAE